MASIGKELREYVKGEMEKRGFELISEAPPINQDILVMLFSKLGSVVRNGKRCMVGVSISGLELLNVGDNYHNLADSRVQNAVQTWNVVYNDRNKE